MMKWWMTTTLTFHECVIYVSTWFALYVGVCNCILLQRYNMPSLDIGFPTISKQNFIYLLYTPCNIPTKCHLKMICFGTRFPVFVFPMSGKLKSIKIILRRYYHFPLEFCACQRRLNVRQRKSIFHLRIPC